MQTVRNCEDGHAVDRVHRFKRSDVHRDHAAPCRHEAYLRFHRSPRRGTRAGDRRRDAHRGGVLADVALVEPEHVQFGGVGAPQRRLVLGGEPRALGEDRAAAAIEDVTAEHGAGPPGWGTIDRGSGKDLESHPTGAAEMAPAVARASFSRK